MKNEILTNSKSLKSNPDHFSAYLNMARHNAYLILSHISDKLKPKKTNTPEDALHSAYALKVLKNGKEPDITAKSIKMLNEHFPFLKVMFDNDIKTENPKESKGNFFDKLPELYYDKMALLLDHLNNYRNSYTHCVHTPIITDKNFIYCLNNIFDASVRTVKDRFEFSENDVSHLRRYEQVFDPETKKRKASRKKDFKYNFIDNDDISEKGIAFFIALFLEKKYAFEFLKKLSDFKDSRTKMMQATLESYCVYHIRLPKERIESTQNDLSLCLDMFNELKKCPSELFDLLKKEDAEKFRIKPDINNLNDEDSDNIVENSTDDYNVEPILKRYSNRFPYLAMRYIDEKKVFQKLRFHVDLGNYYFKFYPKTTVDGEKRDRSLKVHLKSFGRLDDLNHARLVEWNDLIRFHKEEEDENPIEELMPYITDTYPHYHLNNNQIGLKDTQNNPDKLLPKIEREKTKTEQPDFWLSIYELPALLFYSYLLNEKRDISAEDLILNCRKKYHALFKLIFEGHKPETKVHQVSIKKNGKNESVSLLTVHFKDYTGKSYDIELNDLPQVFQNYLTDKPLNNREVLADRKINRLIIETERKREKINKDLERINALKGNKRGKKNFVEIKSGVLADFLVKDMIRLQPSTDAKGKDKITGLNFQILQSHLAFYGRDFLMLKDIFRQCKLVDSSSPHPFLSKLNPENHFDIISFYKAYLGERKIYLEQCNRNKDYKSYYFLKFNSQKFTTETTEYCKDLAKKLMNTHSQDNHPINLPRGMFNDAIVEWFKKHGNPQLQVIANNERVNTVYLIQKFFELENDTNQPFYDFQRSYEFIDKLENFNNMKGGRPLPLQRKYYSIQQLADKIDDVKTRITKLPESEPNDSHPRKRMLAALSDYKQNEKLLRLYKTQDRILFLVASDILFAQKPQGLEENDLKLSNVKTKPENDSDKDLLSSQLPFRFPYQYWDVTSKGEIDHKYKKGEAIIFQKKLKLKNYGDFIRYTKDRRLNNLFHWTGDIELEMPVLQKELVRYEEARLTVFRLIHDFEKAMYEKHHLFFDELLKTNKLKKENENENSYINHEEMLEKFFSDYPELIQYEDVMLTIRNCFSHNQYPVKCAFDNIDSIGLFEGCPDIESEHDNELNIAMRIKNHAIATYGEFIKMLTNLTPIHDINVL
jgi:hypothetical protein